MTWINLESFSTTTHVTYISTSFFLDERFNHTILEYLLHLFIVTRLKLVSENYPLTILPFYIRDLSSFYDQVKDNTSIPENNQSPAANSLMSIFLSHFEVAEEELTPISLLKIDKRIFITKDETMFPSDSLSVIKGKLYSKIALTIYNRTNHPFFPKYKIKKGQESALILPELTPNVIKQIRDLYEGLLEELFILTPKDEYERKAMDVVFDYLSYMFHYFNIQDD